MCAIFAFVRRVDDARDVSLHRTQRPWLLAQARAGVPHDGTPRRDEAVPVALRDVKRRFPIPLASLDDFIDGVESDLFGGKYATFEDLARYCRQVAGSIGRLSIAVLGSRDPATAAALADDLGVAMQLTNILRDLVEGFECARLYLPREDLALFGWSGSPLSAPPDLLCRVIRYEARRNREWYKRGLLLLPLLDARGGACIEAIAGIYTSVLDRIERTPNDVLRGRISLSAAQNAPATPRPPTRPQEGSRVPHDRSTAAFYLGLEAPAGVAT